MYSLNYLFRRILTTDLSTLMCFLLVDVCVYRIIYIKYNTYINFI